MVTTNKPYRYQLPKKAVKGDCPECGHRKTLSRYVDTRTGDALPEPYGRCDRESNCSYHLSPYHKGPTGLSYAEEMNPNTQSTPIPKAWFKMAGKWKRNGSTRQGVVSGLQDGLVGATSEQAERVAAFIYDQPIRPAATSAPIVYTIPDEVFLASLGHYERNQFARLLTSHFSEQKANGLLTRFQIGTSSRWPGSCVFWYIDEQNRKRGGQIKLFDESFHTAKYVHSNGETRSKTSWVHSALARKLDEKNESYPDWLTSYLDERNAVEKSPCLFGLPQLVSAPADQPVAIVEAPKTAVICTAHLPGFLWMAVGALSYLNAERLAPLRGRTIMLFPDLSKDGTAFARWSRIADELRIKGFQISVSAYLEDNANEEEKAQGLDLADYLLRPAGEPELVMVLSNGARSEGEILKYDPCDTCPVEWDTPAKSQPAPVWIPTARIAFSKAPLVWDSVDQLRRIRWAVLPIDADETTYIPPVLVDSPNREDYARKLGIEPDQLPLYRLQSQTTKP